MNNIKITCFKELRSMVRDKKTFKTLFLLPIIIPIFIMFFGYTYDSTDRLSKEDSLVGVNFKVDKGIDKLFDNNKIKNKYYNDMKSLKKAYKENKIDGYIYFDKKEDKYIIYADSNSSSGSITLEKSIGFMESYNKVLGTSYVISNGLDSKKVYNSLSYEVKELQSTNIFVSMISSICISYVILSIVVTATNMAMSSTATEKENGTLETILTLPVSSTELIVGKLIASTIMGLFFSIFSFIMTFVGLYLGSNYYETFKDFNIDFGFAHFISIFVILICASLLISAIAICLTAFAKTTKEAQSKCQMLSLFVMVPMFIQVGEITLDFNVYLIPVCNYVTFLMDLFNNVSINYTNLLYTVLSSIVFSVVMISRIIVLYKSERVLFTN